MVNALIAILVSSSSAETLTLNLAVQEAYRQSPIIKKAESELEQASWRRVESYSGFLPSLSAGANYITSQHFMYFNVALPGTTSMMPFPEIMPSSDLVLNAQLPLFDGFANVSRLRAARSFERAADQQLTWTKFQIEHEVWLQFYRALSAKILKEVAERNVETIEDHLKDVTYFKQAGVSTNYDVLRVEVQVSEAKSELLNSVDNMELARTKLAEVLGRDGNAPEVAGEMPIFKKNLLDKLNVKSLENRADLQSLEERSQAMVSQESAESRYWVPKIAMFGQYQYYNDISQRIFDNGGYRDAYQFGFSLTWNFFDGMASIARSQQAVEQRYQSQKDVEIAHLKASQDLEFWKRKFAYYCTVYEARKSDVEKSNESVRLAKEGRRAGARTNSDLLDAELELFRARAGVVNAQMGAAEALINLELSTGQQIARFSEETHRE